jgi:hypothetical protein
MGEGSKLNVEVFEYMSVSDDVWRFGGIRNNRQLRGRSVLFNDAFNRLKTNIYFKYTEIFSSHGALHYIANLKKN